MMIEMMSLQENLMWIRDANKYAENTIASDTGFYKEYDFITDNLGTKRSQKHLDDQNSDITSDSDIS